MSKRARLDTEDAKRAGLHAWETNDGRRWLMKSLNPNDVAITSTGIPSLSTRNISVLNWQGEYTAGVPANLTASNASYDTQMFLFQHPIIFGVSACRQQGTIDMRQFRGRYGITRNGDEYIIEVSEDNSTEPIQMTTCNRYLNNQLNPDAFGKKDNLNAKVSLFKLLTQKSRICYGGATIIPTCSDQYNSGSISVCQQVFNPRRSVVSTASDLALYTYMENDFPSTTDAVQNPQMYYGKFQDGAYIPYKLVEPLNSDYVNSETGITTRAPYWVTSVSLILARAKLGATDVAAAKTVQVQSDRIELPAGKTGGMKMVFKKPTNLGETTNVSAWLPVAIRFTVVSYTGQKGYITYSIASEATYAHNKSIFRTTENTDASISTVAVTNNSGLTPWKEDTLFVITGPGTYSLIPWTQTTENNVTTTTFGTYYFELPELLTMYDLHDGYPLSNAYGSHYVSQDTENNTDTETSFICPYNGSQIVSINMSGVSNTAPIKMILRYGVEILLVASSIYSPFKFISPKYDESAIKSYARCARNMKDAYFANAGSTIGQVDFVNKILNMIETDAPDDMRVLNQGGQWTGVVGAF